MKTIRLFFLFSTSLFLIFNLGCSLELDSKSVSRNSGFETRDLIKYVDESIGTEVGKCSYGVSIPFGSIRPCPHNFDRRNGYNLQKDISGFTLINTGSVYKYSCLQISPQIGLDCWDDNNGPTSHDSGKMNEICQPDYYTVDLTKYNIKTEFTSSHFSSIFRITYPETNDENASLVIYPSYSLFSESNFSTLNYNPSTNQITGYIYVDDGWYYSKGKVYYAIELSKPAKDFGLYKNHEKEFVENSDTISGEGVGCFFKFDTKEDEQIFLKAAISTRSVENAQKYLQEEIPGWDFDQVRSEATSTWNKALSSILIDDETISDDEKTIFYTALYHSLISPKNRTGDCPWNYDGPYFDDHLCVWDTFRSEFPLLTLIQESTVRENIKSFCEIFSHYGYAYDAFLVGAGDMIQGGDNVDVLIADAYSKGMEGIDWEEAYKVLKGHATESGRSPHYLKDDQGWVPINTLTKMSLGSVSKSLEFSYNDYCASVVAGGLGYTEDSVRFAKRSSNWQSLWDKSVTSEGFSGFVQAKDTTGKFVFLDPATNPKGSFSLHFYEGDSWTYSFFAPHQMSKLIDIMGGKDAFIKRLDYYVDNRIEIYNEPCFMTPFLFAYGLRSDLSSKYGRKVSQNFTRQNYPGDEDSGAMSSWFIFSRLGFFPVAGQDLYLVNGPRYKKVTIQMENGKKLIINGDGASDTNLYVQSASINGEDLSTAWFKHTDIKDGAELNFNMSDQPGKWGETTPPPSY
ncbi:GH92 family glycosyl hydrolase [Sunxiuqinia sp. A32]|uniref:GH92 family glycosyl hydrolase n=1 Tax=Sunxiuqinia sp. A32 TaxID=3461496 RepID=UPI0040454EA6